MRRMVIIMMLAGGLAAAETLPRPEVPDPFGLGERLALIDHLQERYRITPPADATYDQLVVLYWKAHGGAPASAAANDEAALDKDRLQRLRAELKDRHGVEAPADADEVALRRLLSTARTAETQRQAEAASRTTDRNRQGLSASEAGNVQARIDRSGTEIRQLQERIARIEQGRSALEKQAQEVLAQKNVRDGEVAAVLAERNRWVKAAETEARGGHMVAPTTRDSRDKADRDYRAAIDAANATVDEFNRLKAEYERLGTEQQRLQARIAEVDRERVNEAARLTARPSGDGAASAAGMASAEGRLRSSVVLIMVKGQGSGTGFFVSADGLVVTNAHVVGNGTAPMMALWDNATRHPPVRLQTVQVVAEEDLALLRAEGTGFTPLAWGEIRDLGQPLVAAGFPLAGDVSRALGTSPADIVVTRGTLSAVRRQGERVRWLQHDCRIASGNSGGPLVDPATGAVVGVNTMVMTPGTSGRAAGDGLNLAIPVWRVRACFPGLLMQDR